jgi:hypothetical protein
MMETRSRVTIFRRVVVGFRDTSESLSSLEAAARFAQRFDTALLGLFIEDAALMAWSGSRELRHVSRAPAGHAEMTPERLAEDFAAAAAVVRQRFVRVAAELGLSAEFHVERAGAGALEFPGIGPQDLLVVAEPADPMARFSYPFRGALQAIALSAVPVLYFPHRAVQRTGPVVAILRPEDAEIGEVAADIASALGETVTAFHIGSSRDAPPASREPGAQPAARTVLPSAEGIRDALATVRECLIVISRAALPIDDPLLFATIASERMTPVLVLGPAAVPR